MSGAVELRREALPPPAELEAEWRALEAVARPSFFTSWVWIGAMLAAVPAARRPMLLRGRAQGETVALALLGSAVTSRRHGLVRSRGLYLNETGDPHYDAMTIEHNGILTAPEREPAVLDALLGWFAGLRGEADELYLSGSLQRLPAAALAGHRLMRSEFARPSYSVELDRLAVSDGALDPVLSANSRQQLRRAFRRFEAQGPLSLREAASEAEAQDWFTGLKALHCASWARRGVAHSFAGGFFEPFHRRLIERSFAEGAVQLVEARAGARVIGCLYNFRRGGRLYAYQSGFADADPRERPGAVTHALAIRHAFQSGLRVYDFMAGHNRLKASFATRCEPMLWQVVQQPRLALRLEHLAQQLKARIRAAKKALAGRIANR
ncbi:MAG TPA: GNAT family N-acetyltransferase [Stellaceae bacterium]|jgi:CelD/BcsL family acetyltransferase involved in cellulose biosynthesis